MTIRQIAKELTAQGYNVRYRVRKDGGILITKIDNKRFTGATGNKVARQLTGQTISEARRTQLERITRERTDVENLYKEYRRVKRKWTKGNLPKQAGNLTFKKFKRAIAEKGKEEALRFLGEKEKYASGIAYSKNIEALASYVEQTASLIEVDEFYDLADEIRANDGNIRDEWIQPATTEMGRALNEIQGAYSQVAFQNYLHFTNEEVDQVNVIAADLGLYLDDHYVGFITGTYDIEKDWDEYVKKCQQMGADELTKIYQTAYNRYYGIE